ncbi:MAG TPA: hypothetical protein VLX32_03715 [Candidatus Acidoferrum sp.]|nr:hypothetical protein [Candidatus Acidoferrum sp.]
MSTELLKYRRIVEDFSLTTLAAIPSTFGRLVYVSSLRDLSTGEYEHAGLAAVYPGDAVQQALALCHEEVFLRILETPLSLQEQDLCDCLREMSGGLSAALLHWRRMEAYRVLIPERVPAYLKELFCSNLAALLEILSSECSTARSGA